MNRNINNLTVFLYSTIYTNVNLYSPSWCQVLDKKNTKQTGFVGITLYQKWQNSLSSNWLKTCCCENTNTQHEISKSNRQTDKEGQIVTAELGNWSTLSSLPPVNISYETTYNVFMSVKQIYKNLLRLDSR